MNCLILAATLVCTNCINGYVSVPCDICNGSGYVYRQLKKVPCRSCPDGLYDERRKSTGKKKVKCPVCRVDRKISKTLLRSDRKK